MLQMGLIGCGHWGPNLARNFILNRRTCLTRVCDVNSAKAKDLSVRLKGIPWTSRYEEILDDKQIEAVAVATPLPSHYQIVKDALSSGKHVFVEKPLSVNYKASLELTSLAVRSNLVLMVGYVFLFNCAIKYAKKVILDGLLGEIYYIHSVRSNLGPIRTDSNCLSDLASHDIAIMLYWLGQNPVTVNANGARFLGNPFDDVAIAQITFENGQRGFLHTSWLDPCKL